MRLNPAVVFAAALVAAAPFGCGGAADLAGFPAHERRATLSDLREPEEMYLSGDFAGAREAYSRLAWTGGPSYARAVALHGLARCEFALGRMGGARAAAEELLRILARLSGSHREFAQTALEDLTAYGLVLLADVALAQKRPAEALDHLDRLRREGLEGRAGGSDQTLFRLGVAAEAAGRTDAARQHFSVLASRHPESPLAYEASARADGRQRPAYEARAGVFESRHSAEAVALALRRDGFRPRVEAGGGDRPKFVVLLGRFERLEEAERMAARASAGGFAADVSVRTLP